MFKTFQGSKYILHIIRASGSCKQRRSFHKCLEIETRNMDAVKAMKQLGYGFNADGQLRKIGDDGKPGNESFQFNVSNDHQECQTHYEKLGDVVTDYVYHLMKSELNLIQLSVPKDAEAGKGTFIFVSKDYDKKNTLIVLIHGSGAVRAGQWARSLIINENLDKGTQIVFVLGICQIPYIKRAQTKDYGIMVLNTNDNCLPDGKKIKSSGSAEEHASYVWNNYINNTKADKIVIVAHSYGGMVTVNLADENKKDFEQRVKAIVFTDSVHGYSNVKVPEYMKKISRNWITSISPLDTPMKTPDYDICRVSAGTQKHEMTSYSCIDSAFKYIEEKLKK